jgi:hypothetical protein
MEKIPTAEEFLRKNIDYVLSENDCKEDVENAMIEFAKLHVEQALKTASKGAKVVDVGIDYAIIEWAVDKSSILNSYPLDKIK